MMPFSFAQWVTVGLCVAIGGVVGFTKILCSDGTCAITGSWYGGASMGLFVGLALNSALDLRGPRNTAKSPEDTERQHHESRDHPAHPDETNARA